MVVWQVILACLVGSVLLLSVGPGFGLAGLIGGLLAAFFSGYVALRFFAVRPEAGGQQMLQALFRAQAMKWVWAMLVFGFAAQITPDYFLPLMIGFMVSFVVNWLALLWYPNGVPRKQ
ncbi:MAG: ATP synthase subunit I [Immundisolibacteraceae bacterium]|nr:ATP synthase subunit I [Immundisolibacteraceae bacterium]